MSKSNEKIVTEFCMSLAEGTAGFAAGKYLAEDVYYLNVPMEPIHGREGALGFLEPFIRDAGNCLERMEIPTTVASGDTVMNERVEYWVKGEVRATLPVTGVFEVRDGLIVSWRDYFDLATIQPFLDAALKEAA